MLLFFCVYDVWLVFNMINSNLLSPSLRSAPAAPSATPEVPAEEAAAASSASGPARLSMLLAADRHDGVEAGEMTEALTTVAWGLKQLGRASGGMASISRARISSAYMDDKQRAWLNPILFKFVLTNKNTAKHCWEVFDWSCYRCQVQSSLPLLVLHGGVSTVSQQQRAKLCTTLLGCLVEGGESPFVCSIHTRIVLDKQGCNIHMLWGREARGETKKYVSWIHFKFNSFVAVSVNKPSQDR